MSARKPLSVQPVSLQLAWNEPEENLKRVEEAVSARLAASGAPSEQQLLLFPELALTGFVTKAPRGYDLNPPDQVLGRLCAIASRHKTAIAAGFPEHNLKNPKRPFNTVALIGPDGKVVSSYRKMHLFTVGGSPESAVYSAGANGVTCVYRGWKIGFAICFDIRFSGLIHQYARAGIDLILVPACWIGGPHKSYQYQTLNSAHAILSQAYVAAVNQSGKDPYYEYDGAEYVFSPFGENLFKGAPCHLESSELEACRKLSVRSADIEPYRIVAQPRPAP